MFARRRRRSALGRLRQNVWPSMGFRRAARYVGHRVARLPDTPGSIAGGLAWGAAVSFTPFIGVHILFAAVAAWATRCNVLASAIGTAIGNPWTFPFIWAAIYKTGNFFLGADPAQEPPLGSLARLFSLLWRLAGEGVRSLMGLGAEPISFASWREVGALAEMVLWPMAVGSVPYVAAVWFAIYFIGRRALASYRAARLAKASERRENAGAAGDDVPNI